MNDVGKRDKIISKPNVVIDYNDTMGGVDRVNQHFADYAIPRKRALWNSFVIYKKKGGTQKALQYRSEIIRLMMEKYHHPDFSAKSGCLSNTPNPLRLTERHFPDYIPVTEKKKNPPRHSVKSVVVFGMLEKTNKMLISI
ncbi:hypothetical protein JTB14_005031 [Gonioctena quinquepunctata]|nr:hypothetical protein JTB14_005031 [Gonioctena quinquepunctata]